MEKPAYSFAEVAAMLGTATPKVQEEVRAGRLTARVSQGALIITSLDLQRYLATLPTLAVVSADVTSEAAKKDNAAARARGRAVVTAMQNRPVHPAQLRGQEIAQKLLGKDRRK